MNKILIVVALVVLASLAYGVSNATCQSCEGFGTMPQLRLPVYYSRQGYAMNSYAGIPEQTKYKRTQNCLF